MKIKIKRFDQGLPIPEYKTAGSVAFDLYVRNAEVIKPKEVKLVPTGIGIKIPKGHFLWIAPRSSTTSKYNLIISAGVVDQDYCGEEDELRVQVVNIGTKTVHLERGWRIAQGILVKISQAKFLEVEKMEIISRGGFGTTGQ